MFKSLSKFSNIKQIYVIFPTVQHSRCTVVVRGVCVCVLARGTATATTRTHARNPPPWKTKVRCDDSLRWNFCCFFFLSFAEETSTPNLRMTFLGEVSNEGCEASGEIGGYGKLGQTGQNEGSLKILNLRSRVSFLRSYKLLSFQ